MAGGLDLELEAYTSNQGGAERRSLNMFYLNGLGIICALGSDKETIKRRVFEKPQTGIFKSDAYSPGRALPVGKVADPNPEHKLPVVHRSRNNQLALGALGQI